MHLRRLGVILVAATPVTSATAGRLALGFHAGAASGVNDHERWGTRGLGYGYFGEVGYEGTPWLVAPLASFGYIYTNGDIPRWEQAGYGRIPTGIHTETTDFGVGGRVRATLWRMKLRPGAGAALLWKEYHRQVMAEEYELDDRAAGGHGFGLEGGLEFFPEPARGFSLALGYRYEVTQHEWRRPPEKAPGFDETFELREQLLTFGVRLYTP